MRAEIIAIGDELTSGQRLDTNSQWLSVQLAELGIPVRHHTTVGDELPVIQHLLLAAFERSDIIITSGGLGPTADDVTRHALAEATGRGLVRDESVLNHIRALFARRGRTMPDRNVIQAEFPEGSVPIDNPHGTAPGIRLELPGENSHSVVLFALPGVPAELRQMWSESLVPDILQQLGSERRFIRCRAIRTFGAGESDVERMLPDIVRRGRQPLVGITASQATITLRVTAEGASTEECDALIEPTVATIYECLGSLIFGEGDDELHQALNCLLSSRRATLATAEIGTGGLIASWMSGTRGENSCYRGGLVLPTRRSAARLLGADDDEGGQPAADDCGFVAALARRVRDRLAADYGLAVGPFPQEAGESAPGQTARLYCALAGPHGVTVDASPFAAHPAIRRTRSAKHAVNLVRLALLGSEDPQAVPKDDE